MGGKGGGIGPHNSIQPRAPKKFNPALLGRVGYWDKMKKFYSPCTQAAYNHYNDNQ